MASEQPTVEQLQAEIAQLRADNRKLHELMNKDRRKHSLDRAALVQARALLQGSQRSLRRTVQEKRNLQEALKVMTSALDKSIASHGKAVQAHHQVCAQTGTPFVDKSA